MSNFNETIIITDPCYISSKDDWGEKFDYKTLTISKDLGFKDYKFYPTHVGDGSWSTYKVIDPDIKDLCDFSNSIENAFWEFYNTGTEKAEKVYNDLHNKLDIIGKYCVDSGMIGIFYESDILNYNPNFYKEYKPWCYTKIVDFCGEIDYISDDNGEYHWIGTGNIKFLTTSNN